MRKKLKEYFRRFLSVLLCISIFCVFVISPVSASSIYSDLELIDVLSLQESDYFYYEPNVSSYTVSFPFDYTVRYIDAIVASNVPFTAKSHGFDLNVKYLGSNYYKVYGAVSYRSDTLALTFISNYNFGFIIVSSLCAGTTELYSSDVPYSINLYNKGNQNLVTADVSAGSSYTLPSGYSSSVADQIYGFDFTIYISPNDWKLYDFLMMRFDMRSVSINSCLVTLGDFVLSYDLSLSSTSFEESYDGSTVGPYTVPISHYGLVVDLSSVDHNSNDFISIQVTGSYPSGYFYSDLGTIYFIQGFTHLSSIDVEIVWYRRLWNSISNGFLDIRSVIITNWSNFSNTFTLKMNELLDVFNGNNSEASEAIQKQEEINVSVNNQLVGAVEDWNTNIEVVETGYDMAFSKTTPALAWLAFLADGIFNGMGWFGNVYFLVGLISVIMLVLSKSGLAHKIGSISRRKGD